jgi:copper chaperone CopZ
MKTEVKLRALRTDQCPASIRQAIGIQPGVYGVQVDMVGKVVTVDHTDEISSDRLVCLIQDAVDGMPGSCSE